MIISFAIFACVIREIKVYFSYRKIWEDATMNYKSVPEPRPRIYDGALECELEDIFCVDRYRVNDPVFVIDFASDCVAFERFTEGENLDQLNEALREDCEVGLQQRQTKHVINPCVAMCDDKMAIVLLKADYCNMLHAKYVTNCSEVKKIRSFSSKGALILHYEACRNMQCSFFKVGLITSLKDKESIYSVCHNLFFVGDRLYLSANVNRSQYSALDVANYLTATTTLIKDIGCTENLNVYTKIDIHSPGNILFYIDRAIRFCTENWMGILVLFIILAGGKLKTGKFCVELPSFINLVDYFCNWENKRKIEKELAKQASAKTKEMELNNELKALEIDLRRQRLLRESRDVVKLRDQLGATPANGNSTDPQKVLDVVEKHTMDSTSKSGQKDSEK